MSTSKHISRQTPLAQRSHMAADLEQDTHLHKGGTGTRGRNAQETHAPPPHTETHTQRHRQTHTQTHTHRHTHRHTQTYIDTHRDTDRHTQTQTDRHTHTHTHVKLHKEAVGTHIWNFPH